MPPRDVFRAYFSYIYCSDELRLRRRSPFLIHLHTIYYLLHTFEFPSKNRFHFPPQKERQIHSWSRARETKRQSRRRRRRKSATMMFAAASRNGASFCLASSKSFSSSRFVQSSSKACFQRWCCYPKHQHRCYAFVSPSTRRARGRRLHWGVRASGGSPPVGSSGSKEEELVFRGLQDIVNSCREMKSCKNRKLKEVLCVVFRSLKKTRKKCVYFVHNCLQFHFTYTTYKPSHHNHSIIPLSNHHTIIIPKSIELRNICLLVASRRI